MIAIQNIDGFACPFIICDICGKRITEPMWAMAAWAEDASGSLLPVHYVHKRACLDRFEARLRTGDALMTNELVQNLACLIANTRIATDAIESELRKLS